MTSALLEPFHRSIDRLPSPNFLPDDFLELLKSPDFETRLQTLNRAVGIARRDVEWFNRFAKKGELFKCLDRILTDERWELQHQCIKFLVEAMPTFGNATEYCMCYVMPSLIPKLASQKITVRRICQQAMVTFLRLKPDSLQSVLKILSNFMTNSREINIKNEVIHEIQCLFIPELSKSNWTCLVETITSEININGNEEIIGGALNKLRVLIGNDAYRIVIATLPAEKRDCAENLIEKVGRAENPDLKAGGLAARASIKLQSGGERRLRFGIVPSVVAALISDDNDPNQRIAGLEKLKQIVDQITPEEINRLVPHLHSYLILLSNVLSDLNFKVVVLTLDIIRSTVHNLRSHIEAHLQQVVSLISKHFGNQKSIIKQLIMMTFMDLFQNLAPKTVAGTLRVYTENKNSRTREEVINILTAALMTISPSKINLTAVISNLVPLLNDPKRRVRLAAFEQLSVVSYLLNGKTESLMKVVRELENEQNARGIGDAVLSRIRRQSLPRIRYDGLIEYSTPPVSDTSFAVDESEMSNPENADLTWILHSGGRDIDPFDRTVSPVSLAGNLAMIRRNRLVKQQEQQQHSSEAVIPEIGSMTRMKSDDSIVRRQGSAISNPNSSTSSWEHPKMLEKVKSKPKPRNEVNNNHVKKRLKSLISRSETNLAEEQENLHHSNLDDRPAKASGQYSLQDFDALEISMGKKSVSHHSLPITSHPPLKHVQSQPQRRNTNNNFLKSGQGQRTKSVISAKAVREQSNLKSDPTQISVQGALKKIESDEWSDKVEGLNMITTISQTHSKQVAENLKEIVISVLNECKNLRSSVSRVAIVAIGTIGEHLNSRIDPEMERICAVLLNKAGDVSNAFIRDDATESLNKLVRSASAGKSLNGLIAAGARSKNNTIRASCASFVRDIVEIQGSSSILNNPNLLSTLLPVLIQFCKDQTPQVRQFGKHTLCYLNKDANFDRLMRKNASDGDSRAIKEIMSGIERRVGGGDTTSLSGTISRSGSTRRVQKKLPDSVQLDLDEIRTELLASGWERRQCGLQRFEEMCSHASRAVASDTRLIEAFIARLGDLNAKVAATAMDTFLATLATMARLYSTESNLKAVLNQLMFALTAHLSSKSEEHRHLAQTCIQHTIKSVDSVALLPAFVSATKKSNVKQRAFITLQFCELCKLAFKSKPKQVEVSALPFLWEFLKSGATDPENKRALQEFAKTMAQLMGEKSLLDSATIELDPNRKKLLENMIRG